MNGHEMNQRSIDAIFGKKIHTKTRDAFKDKLVGTDNDNMVLTWAIGTPENPMKEKSSEEKNKQLCKEFETFLKHGNFVYEKVTGQYGNEEHSYFIPNISINDAKTVFMHFGQESFIFGQKDYDDKTDRYYLEMEFWQRKDLNSVFKLIDMQDHIEDAPNAIDYFTKSHGFKFNIPFDFSISSASLRFYERFNFKSPKQINSEVYVYLTKGADRLGFARWRYRGRMLHKPLAWELDDGLRNYFYESWKD